MAAIGEFETPSRESPEGHRWPSPDVQQTTLISLCEGLASRGGESAWSIWSMDSNWASRRARIYMDGRTERGKVASFQYIAVAVILLLGALSAEAQSPAAQVVVGLATDTVNCYEAEQSAKVQICATSDFAFPQEISAVPGVGRVRLETKTKTVRWIGRADAILQLPPGLGVVAKPSLAPMQEQQPGARGSRASNDEKPPPGASSEESKLYAGLGTPSHPSVGMSTLPPPTFATTRASASMLALGSGGQRYTDMGSDKNFGFVLEQRGSLVLLQQDGSKEILTLIPVPTQQGDSLFTDSAGRTVLKVTKAGNVISYLYNSAGAPAQPTGRVPPISSPAMTAALDLMRSNAANELSRLAGHDVTLWGTYAFASNEAWATDALSILVLGVKKANDHNSKAASAIEKVTLRLAKAPKVSLQDGELIVELNPDDAWGGRVMPQEISNALTAALEPKQPPDPNVVTTTPRVCLPGEATGEPCH